MCGYSSQHCWLSNCCLSWRWDTANVIFLLCSLHSLTDLLCSKLSLANLQYLIHALHNLQTLARAYRSPGAGNWLYFSFTQGNGSCWVTACAVTQNTDIFFLKRKKKGKYDEPPYSAPLHTPLLSLLVLQDKWRHLPLHGWGTYLNTPASLTQLATSPGPKWASGCPLTWLAAHSFTQDESAVQSATQQLS